MGVKGLMSFMKQNPHLFRDYQLKDTNVVIDGNNLYHFLFYESGIDARYGGDYFQYWKSVHDYFVLLLKYRVTPYVVFDGGHAPTDSKLQQMLGKATDQIARVKSLKTVTPLLTYEVFRQELASLGIPFVVCDFDADHDAAVLANDMNCPLLSMDSDFFVFPINAGFIPFDSLIEVQHEGHIKCKIYFSRVVSQFFPKLGEDALVLIATLPGNDLIPKNKLWEFYKRQSKEPSKSLSFNFDPRNPTYLRLFNWLTRQRNLSSALAEVIGSLTKEREATEASIMESVNHYTLDPSKSRFPLRKHFKGDAKLRDVHSKGGNAIPGWVLRAHERGEVSMVFQNVITLRRNIFRSQVEDIGSPSSFVCATPLRQILYGILTSMDVQIPGVETRVEVEEVDRCLDDVQSRFVSVCGNIPRLSDIPTLAGKVRKEIFLRSLEYYSDSIGNLPDDMLFLVTVIRFCHRKANPIFNANHVKSLLCCVLMLNVKCIGENLEPSGLLKMRELQAGDAMMMKSLSTTFEPFERSPSDRREMFDARVTHAFAQFQACFMAALDLNHILLNPFPNLNPAGIIHGTILYNLYRKLEQMSDSDSCVAEVLKGHSGLMGVFTTLRTEVFKGAQN